MIAHIALRNVLKSSAGVFRESGAVCAALFTQTRTCSSALMSGLKVKSNVTGSFALQPHVRHYAQAPNNTPDTPSQLSDLPSTMLKVDYAAVPLAQTTDDIVKRLLSVELASHAEKLQLKKEQLIKKVQRDESDRSSEEVRVAILTARIRNYQEHMHKHRKDKANKRRMLMTIDKRKKILKNLRMVRYDAFEMVCKELNITYTLHPEYNRTGTRRGQIKKALCLEVRKEVKRRKEEKMRMKKTQEANTQTQ